MYSIKIPFILLFTLMLISCASITNGKDQEMSFYTTPHTIPSYCKITDIKGRIYQIKTPETLTISRGYGPLTVACHGEDYKGHYYEATILIEETANAYAYANIVSWGLIGVAVDGDTGAYQQYENDKIIISLRKIPDRKITKKNTISYTKWICQTEQPKYTAC